jgi:hypothetical protein
MVLETFKSSGLTVKQFCKDEGLSEVAQTTTVLQPKDTISTKRCDIYHLLSAEI